MMINRFAGVSGGALPYRRLGYSALHRWSSSSAAVVGEISYLDIRVGKITQIADHPADSGLYIQSIQIDAGETQTVENTKSIVAGIRKYCTKDELLNSTVIVLCNLKPRVIRGVDSTGMVLCCSNIAGTEVKPIRPPVDCPIGTRISFPGFQSLVDKGEALSFNRINKAFGKVAPNLIVDSYGIAMLKVGESSISFTTPLGAVTGSIVNSAIS